MGFVCFSPYISTAKQVGGGAMYMNYFKHTVTEMVENLESSLVSPNTFYLQL